MLTGTNVVSRDRQLRSGRVLRVGVASLGQVARAMARELKEYIPIERSTCVGGLLDVDLQRVWRTRHMRFNVETWPYTAYGSRIRVPAA